jgi:precorrin-6B methylase 1
MEIIDCSDLVEGEKRNSWLSIAIMNLIDDKYKEILPGVNPDHTKQIEVELKFNGVEVSLSKFIEHLQSQYENMVRRTALRMVEDKFSDMTEVADKIKRYARSKAKDILYLYGEDDL